MHHLALKVLQSRDLGPGRIAQVPLGSDDHIGIVIKHLASRQLADLEIPILNKKEVSSQMSSCNDLTPMIETYHFLAPSSHRQLSTSCESFTNRMTPYLIAMRWR